MIDKWMLDEWGNPVPVDDLLEWGRWFETADRTLRRSWLGPNREIWVSTVFLGLDHNFSGMIVPLNPLVYQPVLWETMVFQSKKETSEMGFRYHPEIGDIQQRYMTREEALNGHQRIVDEIAATIRDLDSATKVREHDTI